MRCARLIRVAQLQRPSRDTRLDPVNRSARSFHLPRCSRRDLEGRVDLRPRCCLGTRLVRPARCAYCLRLGHGVRFSRVGRLTRIFRCSRTDRLDHSFRSGGQMRLNRLVRCCSTRSARSRATVQLGYLGSLACSGSLGQFGSVESPGSLATNVSIAAVDALSAARLERLARSPRRSRLHPSGVTPPRRAGRCNGRGRGSRSGTAPAASRHTP